MSDPLLRPGAAPRLGPFAGFGPVFAWGLRLTFRPKRVVLVALFAAGMGVLIATQGIGRVQWGFQKPDRAYDLYKVLEEALIQFAIPLIALTLVAQGYRREISERTLVYHLVRPVSRTTVFLARFFSGVLPAIPVALVPIVTTVALSKVPLPGEVWLSFVLTATIGVVAIGAIYYMLSALLKYGMIAGLIYTFVIEAFLAAIPGSMQRLSVMFHVRSLHHRMTDDVFADLSSRARAAIERHGERGNPLQALNPSKRIEWDEPGQAVLVLLVVAAAALAFGAWRTKQQDYALKD
jgi:ABC-type transport system involved in multi-copper enzyme maturation permease subunit